jgi:hypothetical protein
MGKKLYKITLQSGNYYIYVKAINESEARRLALLNNPISYNDIIKVEAI